MIIELLKLVAVPVAIGGALVGADISALSSAIAGPAFEQVLSLIHI